MLTLEIGAHLGVAGRQVARERAQQHHDALPHQVAVGLVRGTAAGRRWGAALQVALEQCQHWRRVRRAVRVHQRHACITWWGVLGIQDLAF